MDLLLLVSTLVLFIFLTPVKTFTLIPVILFLVISFGVQMMPIVLPEMRETPLQVGVYLLDGIYFIAQLVFSFLAVSVFAYHTTLVWTVCTVMFLLYLAVMILFRSTVLAETKRAETERQNVFSMKNIIMMLEQSRNAAVDADMKKEISAVLEHMRYSDPNSSPEMKETETEIFRRTEALLEQVQSHKTMDAKENCSILQNRIIEYNAMCKMYKR